jgi:dTDP-4-amino-4,6-dideoxygalactose transaminase
LLQENRERTVSGPKSPLVEESERAYADYCGVPRCRGFGTGTDAIELAFRTDES